MPDVGVLASRHQDGHLGLAVGERGRDHFGGRVRESAVCALHDVERQAGEAEVAPRGGEVLGLDRVEVEVDGAEVVGRQRAAYWMARAAATSS